MQQPSRNSSLPLQILVYFHGYYLWLFYILEVLMFIYKSLVLPYPNGIMGWEVAALVFLCIIDAARLLLGSKGNKTQTLVPIFVFMVLTAPAVLGNIFFLLWQTFVVRLEFIINVIAIVFCGLELFLSIITAFSIARNSA